MKIITLGACFEGESIQYAVIGNLNEVVAVLRQDSESRQTYSLSFTTTSYSEIKSIIELLEKNKNEEE